MPFQGNFCDDHWPPFACSVTTSVVSAVLSIITVPGNLLICWAVIWDPKRNLKSSFNYLVLNIAVADLIVGAVTEPVFVGYHANEAMKHRVLGVRWIVYMSFFMTSTASVLSIAALAVNRYRIMISNHVMPSYSTRTAVITSAVVWLCSLGLPLLYLAVGFFLLAFIFVNAAVIVTTGVVIFVYYGVHRRLHQHRKHTEFIHGGNQTEEKRRKVEERVTNSFLLITISFVICFAPSCVMIYVINFCHTCSCDLIQWFRDLQYLFVLTNSASNQFLYAWRMRSFQKAFQTVPGIGWVTNKLRKGRVSIEASLTDSSEKRNGKTKGSTRT